MTDDDVLLQAQRRLVQAEVDDLPVTAAPRVKDRHQERAGAEDRGPCFSERHRHRNRRAIGKSRRELHARERLGDAIVAALAGERPGLAER